MAPQGIELEDTDWLRHRLPVALRSLEKLRAYLAVNGISAEEFKKLPMYTENVSQFAWLRDL